MNWSTEVKSNDHHHFPWTKDYHHYPVTNGCCQYQKSIWCRVRSEQTFVTSALEQERPVGACKTTKRPSVSIRQKAGLFNCSSGTRMHSSRMRTACSSSCPGGSPTGNPLGAEPPGSRHPPGTRHPLHLPGADIPPQSRHTLWEQTPWDQAPSPVDRITDACENITLPQLRCGR